MYFTDASSKSELFRSRYAMLLQRTQRHDLFTPSAVPQASSGKKKFKLKAVEFLQGTVSKLSDVIVLGMLTQE
jgi:DNA polymerase epsilon subunit 2